MRVIVVLLAIAGLVFGTLWFAREDGPPPVPVATPETGVASHPDPLTAGPLESVPALAPREFVPTPQTGESPPAVPQVAGYVTLRGKVVHADDDSPIPDALVTCGPREAFAEMLATESTPTDGDGTFRFTSVPTDRDVRVDALGVSEIVAPPITSGTEVILRIPRTPSIEGEVVDGDERPVAGAIVAAIEGGNFAAAIPAVRTDTEGHFALYGIVGPRWLRAAAKGLRTSDIVYVEVGGESTQTVRFVLSRDPARIIGRVVDRDGNGVPAALVTANPIGEAHSVRGTDGRTHRLGEGSSARCDAEGKFALDGLAPGAVQLRARADTAGYGELRLGESALRTTEITLELRAFARLTGTVREADGSVTPGLSISLRTWPRELGTLWRQVAADGSFVIEGVAPGTFDAQVWRKGSSVYSVEMELAAGDSRRWDVVLPAAGGLAGRIIDPRGLPLEGFALIAWRGGEWLATVTSDGQGRFTMESITSGPVTLRAGRRAKGSTGNAPAPNAASMELTAPDLNVELVVPDSALGAARVRGRVLDPEGSPLGAATLQMSVSGTGSVRFTTGDDGRFEGSELTAGDYFVQVSHGEQASLFVGTRTIAPDEDVDFGDLRLPPSGRVRARVSSADGVAIGAVDLTVLDASGRELGRLRIDGDEYRSGPLPVGPLVLSIAGERLARTREDITITRGAETHIELRVRRGLTTNFVASLPVGAAPPNWMWLSIYDSEHKHLGGVSMPAGEDGAYRSTAWLSPGHYTILLGTDGKKFGAQLEVDIAIDGATVPVTLSPGAGGR